MYVVFEGLDLWWNVNGQLYHKLRNSIFCYLTSKLCFGYNVILSLNITFLASGEEVTVMEEDLRLCTVKPAAEVDRRYCFEVVSPMK